VSGCKNIRWWTAADACALVQRAGSLGFEGDSITRHFSQAVWTVLIGDYEEATMARGNVADEGFNACRCNAAYDDGHRIEDRNSWRRVENKYCRSHSIARFPRDLDEIRRMVPSFCPDWSRLHMRRDRSAAGGFMYVAGGLHATLDMAGVASVFPDDAWPVNGPRLICGLLPAAGKNKMKRYLKTQGNARVREFNGLVRRHACQSPGDMHFDPFATTWNASSIDGTHYPEEPNILLAQLFLSMLNAMVGESGQ
jgi:hypothetical protein